GTSGTRPRLSHGRSAQPLGSLQRSLQRPPPPRASFLRPAWRSPANSARTPGAGGLLASEVFHSRLRRARISCARATGADRLLFRLEIFRGLSEQRSRTRLSPAGQVGYRNPKEALGNTWPHLYS